MIQAAHMPLIIQIECCENCFLHPQQNHSQSEYVFNLSQLHEQVTRIWHSSPVQILKNKVHIKNKNNNHENVKLQNKVRENLKWLINLSENEEKKEKSDCLSLNINSKGGEKRDKSMGQDKIVPRINAFQVRYRNLLVFSKLNYGKFCSHREISNILLQLTTRTEFHIQKLAKTLCQNDLFSTLKSKKQKTTLTLKFIRQQIDKIVEKRPLTCNTIVQKSQRQYTNPNTSELQPPISQQTPTTLQQLQKYISYQASASCSAPRSSITSKKSIVNQTAEVKRRSCKNSLFQTRLGNRIAKLSSMAQQKTENKAQMDKVQKYCYLSKENDIEVADDKDLKYELLQVSEDEEQNKNKEFSEQDLKRLRIEQGLNSKLFELLPQKPSNQTRKYSCDYKKIGQMLQFELQLDSCSQHNSTMKQSRFFPKNNSYFHEKQNQLVHRDSQEDNQFKNNQNQHQSKLRNSKINDNQSQSSSNSYSQTGPMLFQIDEKDLFSRRDLWKQISAEIQDQREGLRNIQQNKNQIIVANNGKEDLVQMQGRQKQEQKKEMIKSGRHIKRLTSLQDLNEECSNQHLEIGQNIAEVFEQLKDALVSNLTTKVQQQVQAIELISKQQPIIRQPTLNFVEGYCHPNIKVCDQLPEPIQIYIDTHFIHTLQPLSSLIHYIHNISPTNFPFLLHNPSLSSISLSTRPSKNLLTLFNPHTGLFSTYSLTIQLSTLYYGKIAHWVIVLCQGIKNILGHCNVQLADILRVFTGAPVVRVNGVNLRAVKKVVYEGGFMGGMGKKGVIICGKDEDNGQLDFCELLSFQKDKDFLKSRITFRNPPTSSSSLQKTQQPTSLYYSKTYQQFVLGYQKFFYFIYNPQYFHTQIDKKYMNKHHQQQQNNINSTITMKAQKQNQSIWKICIRIKQNQCNMFVQFCQMEKLEKNNYITLLKADICNWDDEDAWEGEVNWEQAILEDQEPIGELYKRGNFFFQLNLQRGVYVFKICRPFSQGQHNSIHFYSSKQIQILSSSIHL